VRLASRSLQQRGDDVRVVLLRRIFPPARLFASLARPQRMPTLLRAWVRNDCRSHPLEPPRVTALTYTSPPLQISHDRWGHWAQLLAGRRLLTQAREFAPEIVQGHFATPSGWVAVWLGQKLGVPAVVNVHGADLDYTAVFRARGAQSVASVLRGADAVIANSRQMAERAASLRGTDAGVHVLWQGGDPVCAAAEPVDEWPRVISVGYIARIKGLDCAARALALCRRRGVRFRWTVIGRGSFDDELSFAELLQDLGIAGVTEIRRDLANEEVLEEMAKSDLFLLLSQRDAYGVVFAEALGAGLAVVGSSAAGAVQDFQAAGAPVCVVEPDDAEGAAAAMLPLLEDSVALSRARAASREWASTHLGWARYAHGLEAVFSELTGSRGSHPRCDRVR